MRQPTARIGRFRITTNSDGAIDPSEAFGVEPKTEQAARDVDTGISKQAAGEAETRSWSKSTANAIASWTARFVPNTSTEYSTIADDVAHGITDDAA